MYTEVRKALKKTGLEEGGRENRDEELRGEIWKPDKKLEELRGVFWEKHMWTGELAEEMSEAGTRIEELEGEIKVLRLEVVKRKIREEYPESEEWSEILTREANMQIDLLGKRKGIGKRMR